MKITVEISRNLPNWSKHKEINKNLIKKVVHNILNRFDNLKKIKEIEISLLLTDDLHMQSLNHQFRNKNAVTNVLSFPNIDIYWEELPQFEYKKELLYLGDIAFGYNIMTAQALDEGKSFINHFTHLLVHSILHLLGFDHNTDYETEIMEKLEISILEDFSIASPY